MVGELFSRHRDLLRTAPLLRVTGRVTDVTGLSVLAEGLPLPVGSMCRIDARSGVSVAAQVVGVRRDRSTLFTLRDSTGIATGDPVTGTAGLQRVAVGRDMVGCVLDGLGRPIGAKRDFTVESHYPVFAPAPRALDRQVISRVLSTGVRSIDAMHTLGGGQRIGIFAGTGVGKSVLMGMIARFTSADVIVAALVGERGREVGDFLRKDLGDEGLKRSVMVVSTADESPVLRVRAGFTATAVAEYFRDQGLDVLLMLDSTTRIAMAQRQIGVAAGEPPTTKGYPPSTFDLLPKLLERSGRTARGSITGIYTVLVEGDDPHEPIADAVRGILDGHLWLARNLANRGHYPAVSLLESISRVMVDVADPEHRAAAAEVRRVMAVWSDIEDLVSIGAYVAGTNLEFDVAVQMKPAIDEFVRQSMHHRAEFAETREGLIRLAERIETTRCTLSERSASDTGLREKSPN
jgi:flagellum-specific ATP synthase